MRHRRLPAAAALTIAALLPLSHDPAPRPAFAQEADENTELPLVYAGDGLRVTVTSLDEAAGTLGGTLLLGKRSLTFVARHRTNRRGEELYVGTAAGGGDSMRVRIREESATVAEVRLDGTRYRVVRQAAPEKNEPAEDVPAPRDEPAPAPESEATPPGESAGAGATQAASGTAKAEPKGTIVMKLHKVRDPGTRNIESHAVLAPKGWAVEGHAWWPARDFFKILPSQDIRVTAPDGRRVHIGPSVGATDFQPSEYAVTQLGSRRPREGTASDGYPVIYMPESLAAWKPFLAEKGIRATYPEATNVRVHDVVVVPELTQLVQRNIAPVQKQNEEQNRQYAAMGVDSRLFTDGVVLAATSSYDLEGRSFEQLMVFGVVHSGLDSQVGRQIWWSLEPNVSFRAPAGRLEESMPLLLSISYSLRMTPEWAKMKHEHAVAMNEIAARGARERARIWADHNREINRIITEGHREREAIRDATHRKVINSIRGVEDYTTPGGSTSVQLPGQYAHVYANGSGEYILTDDALYDPNTDPRVNDLEWESMEPVR